MVPNTDNSKKPGLHVWILVGLVVGIVAGLILNVLATQGVVSRSTLDLVADRIADPLGRVFLRLILMVVIPLVVSALALGVLELGDLRKLGRIGAKTLFLTVLLSGTAVMISLVVVNVIQPGKTLSKDKQDALAAKYETKADEFVKKAGQAKKIEQTLLDMIPENPLREMAGALDGSSPGNGILAVMFFSLILGVAISMGGERAQILKSVLEGLFDVSMVIISFAMKLAPVCVALLLFSVTAKLGLDILQSLMWFVIAAITGMAVHLFVVYPIFLVLLAKRSPWQFFKDTSEAMLTAFATSSSNATLPTTMKVASERLKLPQSISRFVLTIGSTGNQNGTALYEGVVVLFIAQLLGHDLSFAQQLQVVLMSVLAGVGTAGVPGGSIPMIAIVLQSVGIDGASIGIILGVDRLLDMCRTVLNVIGDLVLAACVAQGNETA